MTYNYTEDPNAPESVCKRCGRVFDGTGDYCRDCITYIDMEAPDDHTSTCRWCGDTFDGYGDCCGGCRSDFNAEAKEPVEREDECEEGEA